MFDNWVIGVMLRMSSNATQVLGGVEAAARRVEMAKERMRISADKAAGRITGQQAAMQRGLLNVQSAEQALDQARERYSIRQAERLRKQQEEQRRTALFIQGGIALAGASFIGSGLNEAAQLQRAMANISVKTGVTGPGLDAMRAMVQNVSGMTAQSSVTIAQELAKAATGINDPKKLVAAFPQIAKMADVAYLQNGQDPVEAVSIGTSFAHLFKAYSGTPLSHMLDNLNKLMNMQPDNMRDALTQGRQFIPFASQLGVSQDDIFAYMAYMGQTGYLKGRGGTGFQNVLLNAVNASAPTGTLSKAKVIARKDLELKQFQFFDNNKNFRFQALVDKLVEDRNRLKSKTGNDAQFIKDITDLFGKEGGRFIGNIASNPAQSQINSIRKTYARLPGVDSTWETFSKTFLFALGQMATNFKNVMGAIFFPTLNKISPAFIDISNVLSNLTVWFNAHPNAGMAVAITAFAATGSAALGAARNLWALSNAGTLLMAPFRSLWSLFVFIPGPLKLVVLGLAALWATFELFQNAPNIAAKLSNWWAENKGHILYSIGYMMGEMWSAVTAAFTSLGNWLSHVPQNFSGWMNWLRTVNANADSTIRANNQKSGPNWFGAGFDDSQSHLGRYSAFERQKQWDHEHSGPRVQAASQDTHFNFNGNIIVQGGTTKEQASDLLTQIRSQAQSAQRAGLGQAGPTLHRLQLGY